MRIPTVCMSTDNHVQPACHYAFIPYTKEDFHNKYYSDLSKYDNIIWYYSLILSRQFSKRAEDNEARRDGNQQWCRHLV